jgi:hypothetical protein
MLDREKTPPSHQQIYQKIGSIKMLFGFLKDVTWKRVMTKKSQHPKLKHLKNISLFEMLSQNFWIF